MVKGKRFSITTYPPQKISTQSRKGLNEYTIAALLFINSLVITLGGSFYFAAGLGISQFVDGIALVIGKDYPNTKIILTGIAMIFDIVACGIIALFGFLARKKKVWIIVTGMVLYSLDALLVLFLKIFWICLPFVLSLANLGKL